MNTAIETLRNFIDGSWEEAPERMPAVNPATGEGSGAKSGVGRLGGRLTLEAMTEIRMISITRPQ